MEHKESEKEIEELISIIDLALVHSQNGLVAKSNLLFNKIKEICLRNPFILWDSGHLHKLARCFLLMYHFDTYDSEESNILIAHFSYLYSYRTYELNEKTDTNDFLFEALKQLVLVIETCQDCFSHSIAQFYFEVNKTVGKDENVLNQNIRLAERVLPLLAYNFIIEIEDTFHTFRDDQTLESICSDIESEFDSISENLQLEGGRRAKQLFLYILQKVTSRDFSF